MHIKLESIEENIIHDEIKNYLIKVVNLEVKKLIEQTAENISIKEEMVEIIVKNISEIENDMTKRITSIVNMKLEKMVEHVLDDKIYDFVNKLKFTINDD